MLDKPMKLLVIGDFQGVFPLSLKNKIKKEEFDAIIGVGDYAGLSDWRPLVMYNLRQAKKGKPHMSAEEYFGKHRFKKLLHKEEQQTKFVWKTLASLRKPVLYVFGNGDDDWYRYPFAPLWKQSKRKKRFLQILKKSGSLYDITYSNKKFQNILFTGFGGYMDIEAYFDRKQFKDDTDERHRKSVLRHRKAEKKFIYLLKKKSKKHIFVFHYPPLGVFDIIRDKKDNPMNGKSTGVRFFAEAIKKYKPVAVFCGHMHEYQGMKRLYGVPVINPGDAEKGKYAIVEIFDKGKVKARFK
jgi:Icc-related predicted phosphoesterase